MLSLDTGNAFHEPKMLYLIVGISRFESLLKNLYIFKLVIFLHIFTIVSQLIVT